MPQVKAIEVHHDNQYVYGLQLFYQDGKKTDLHFGTHAREFANEQVRSERIELQKGEYLTGMGTRCGAICDSLWFNTSQGRLIRFGGDGGTDAECSTQEASKPYVLAIGAGVGGHIHHIKCFYLDLAEHERIAQLSGLDGYLAAP